MEYEYINSESYEEVQDISIFLIEYFNNDYIVIKDFLIKTPSPWDSVFLMKVNNNINLVPQNIIKDKDYIDEMDLRNIKARILSEIFNNYTMNIIIPFLQEFDNTDDDVLIASLDGTLIDKFKKANHNPEILLYDEFYMIRIIEFYVKTLLIKTDNEMKIDTFNRYKYDVLKIKEIYTKEVEKTNFNNLLLHYIETHSKNDETKICRFDMNIAKKVRYYINMNFRDENDVFGFINYLFSLVYSFILYQAEKGEEIEDIEQEIIDVVEGDNNLTKLFFTNVTIASQIVEKLNDNIDELGKGYDLRHSIKDERKQDILRDLDYNFDDTNENNITIHTYSLDSKLKKLIFFLLLKNGESKFYDIVMDTTSLDSKIYDQLFELGLDPRNSDYYKIEMIKKIVSDVFEYLNYVKIKDIDVFNYNIIKNINSFNGLINYFSNNYKYIIDMYIKYSNVCLFEHEKAKFNIIKNGNLNQLEKIYFYSIDRYLEIFANKYTELKYIDDINEIIDKLNDDSWNITISDLNKIIVYVYERLICEPPVINISQSMKEKLLFYIETREDLSYIEYNEVFNLLRKCFITLVSSSFSNEDECSIRKNIKNENKIKILNKMKKYEQID